MRGRGLDSAGRAGLGALAGLLLTCGAVASTNDSWISSGSGKWETAANWSAGAPGSGKSISLTNSGTKTVTMDATTDAFFPTTLTVDNLLISAPNGSKNTLNVLDIQSSPFTISSNLTIASGGVMLVSNSSWGPQNSMTVSNGSLVILEDLEVLGYQGFLYTVTGPSATSSNSGSLLFALGSSNSMLVANGARVDTGDIYLGYSGLPEEFDTVTVTGSNSLLNVGLWYVGADGSSNHVYIASGGTVRMAGILTLSSDPASQGNAVTLLPGGTLIVGDKVYVGNSSNAQADFLVSGGVSMLSSDLIAGSFSGSTGTFSVTAGGRLVATNGVIGIGNGGTLNTGSGTGSAIISNGTLVAAGMIVGSTAGGLGSMTIQSNALVSLSSNLTIISGSMTTTSTVSITGGSLIATNGITQVGPSGTGRLTISGGSHILRELDMGGTNSSGSFFGLGGHLKILQQLDANQIVVSGIDLDGSGGTIIIGDGHDALLQFDSGTVTNFANMKVGYSLTPAYTGTYTQSGGFAQVTNSLVVGDCASGAQGTVILTGGVTCVTNGLGTATLSLQKGTFTMNSGSTLIVDTLNLRDSCGQFIYNGGTIHYNQILVPVNAPPLRLTITFNSRVSTLTLSWPSIYVGYSLQQTAGLTPSRWTSVNVAPTDNGTTRSVTVPFNPSGMLFRLVKP